MTSPESSQSTQSAEHESAWEDIGYDHPYESGDTIVATEAKSTKEAARIAVRAASQMIPDRDTGVEAGTVYTKPSLEQQLINQRAHIAHLDRSIATLVEKINAADSGSIELPRGQLGLLRERLAEKQRARLAATGESPEPEAHQETLF